MRNSILTIKTKVPGTAKIANISLDGRNLIITGVNGCGKTQFINKVYMYLRRVIVEKWGGDVNNVRYQLKSCRDQLARLKRSDADYETYFSSVNHYANELEWLENPPVILSDLHGFMSDVEAKKAVVISFEATRQAIIRPSKAAKSPDALMVEARSESQSSTLFEEYLVSQKTAQAYAESPRLANNMAEANNIAAWFDKLQDDLRELFEDPELILHYDYQVQAFYIRQKDKDEYRLQQLSSGFSAVLSVYAELLTKIQLGSTAADEVYGVVFIDEIDAHLHVSLQRKILAFLTKSFPRIQFIVSTHSPFVVSSVRDAVIYDLSTLEQVEDLSMYSYESILSGLFNTSPISEVLEEKIIVLADMLKQSQIDIDLLRRRVGEISEHESYMDSESLYFLNKARLVLNKSMSGG